MGRYRKIDVRVWDDERFRCLSAAPPNAQTLWLYLLSGPHTTNVPGLSRIGECAMAEALGWDLEAFRKAFREVSLKGLAKADWNTRIVWIPNAWKYDNPTSPNVVKSWRIVWDELPACPLKDEAWRVLKAFTDGKHEGFRKAFREALAKPSPIPEPEPEPEISLVHSNSEPVHSPAVNRSRSALAARDRQPDDTTFDAFWAVYPRKQAKAAARRAWAKLGTAVPLEALLAAVAQQAASSQWTRDGGQFVPLAATWLNGRRWEDEPLTAVTANGNGTRLPDRTHETLQDSLARQRAGT